MSINKKKGALQNMLLYGLQSQYRKMWSIALGLIGNIKY